jgi:hypothetical protein
MHQPVDQGRCQGVVHVKDFAPFPEGSIRGNPDRSNFITAGHTLEQLIGSALVDGQIVQLIEEENETTFAIVSRVSGGSMIVHPSAEKKGGPVWIRVLSTFANKPAMWPGRPGRICPSCGNIKARTWGVSSNGPETGIGSLYVEFFRGYGTEIRLSCHDFCPNSTCQLTSTTKFEGDSNPSRRRTDRGSLLTCTSGQPPADLLPHSRAGWRKKVVSRGQGAGATSSYLGVAL